MARRACGLARTLVLGTGVLASLAACEEAPNGRRADSNSAAVASAAPQPTSWCAQIPRAANAALETVETSSRWFSVYRVEPGVFAIVEPRQFQEAISYLIVGSSRALLFDGGIGLVPMRPIIEQLTRLPVTVLNSHTHFDHVGANHEFDDVLAFDTPFTRSKERGRPHADIADEVAPDSFCGAPPDGTDTASFRSVAWNVTRRIADGERIDLGDRVLEVIATPGHTPDALVLLDRAHGLLWTGDSYYESTIWLFSPGTDIAAYESSMQKLAALAPSLRRLLPAHNTATADPAALGTVLNAVQIMRRGGGERSPAGPGREEVRVGAVRFMIAR